MLLTICDMTAGARLEPCPLNLRDRDMTTRADVIAAIQAVEARVERMTPEILAHVDARLPEGEWRIREALCHLAARSNSVPLVAAVMERARGAEGQDRASFWRTSVNSIDVVNQAQINDRGGLKAQELLGEIHHGHRAEIAAVAAFDQGALELRIPKVARQGDMTIADLLMAAGPGHDNMHLDQIERAILGQV